MKIRLNKKYRYRNGELARILCIDAPGSQPVVSIGLTTGEALNHNVNGQFFESSSEYSSFDLIEDKEPLECWICIRNHHVDFTQEPENHKAKANYRLFREVI